MVGVIGPNGGGKSTLVRGLSRILAPLSGSVFLDGVDLSQDWPRRPGPPRRRRTQSPNLPEGFTALDIVLMGRTPTWAASIRESPGTTLLWRG